jgi:hypothetical protein
VRTENQRRLDPSVEGTRHLSREVSKGATLSPGIAFSQNKSSYVFNQLPRSRLELVLASAVQ